MAIMNGSTLVLEMIIVTEMHSWYNRKNKRKKMKMQSCGVGSIVKKPKEGEEPPKKGPISYQKLR